MHARARDWALVAAWLALDQASKAWACARLEAPVSIVPGLFRLARSDNRGGLFGWLGDAPDLWRGILLTALPLLAVGAIAALLLRAPQSDGLGRTGLALVLGGACGNVLDRVVRGHVVDFFDVYSSWPPAARTLEFFFRTNHWPTFNVADVGLTVGAVLLLTGLLRRRARTEDTVGAPVSD